MTSDKKPVQDFIALCEASGLENVVITPGSRNAPFSISFWNRPSFKTYSIVDERSAAFFALGLAQQTRTPVLLICTSGTAALNFAPAIAEALYQHVPLIVVSADRPMEWIDHGEGQSIRQSGVYRNIVKFGCDIVQEATDADLARHNVRLISKAIEVSRQPNPGPVHINFPLKESLYGTAEPHELPTPISTIETEQRLSERSSSELGKKLESAKKIMVLAGQLSPDAALQTSLEAFASCDRVVVLTETHSNLHSTRFIGTIDRLINGLSEADRMSLSPDVLITLGENIISRKIKALLRKGSCEHWHLDLSGNHLDTFGHLRSTIPVLASTFFSEMKPYVNAGEDFSYQKKWTARNETNRNHGLQFIQSAPYSDLTVFHSIVHRLPAQSELQMGNSSVVRYLQLFDASPSITYRGNRGVSGIDGCTSTAVGAAYASKKVTTLITGELAFFYDSNAFWNQYVSSQLKVIVINNGGGGIFRIIEGPMETDAFEPLFEATHDRDAEGLAFMYHLPYLRASNAEEVEKGLSWLYQTKECAILEIMTPRKDNDQILKEYFRFIEKNQ